VHKLIASIAAAIVAVIGMRIAGVTFADILKAIGKDASNAAADIKAVANGDYSKGNVSKQPRESTVGANEGDYDPEMKKELAETRQKLMDDRRKAIERFVPGSDDRKALEKMTPEEMRKHIEKNIKEGKTSDTP
jgi:hypothetical protein